MQFSKCSEFGTWARSRWQTRCSLGWASVPFLRDRYLMLRAPRTEVLGYFRSSLRDSARLLAFAREGSVVSVEKQVPRLAPRLSVGARSG
jgi:hypothetical protein